MAVTVTMPQLGETVTEGTILSWAKQVGDTISEDEVLLEISTDKVDTEVPSPASGTILEILVTEGTTVEVGTALAVIGEASEQPAAGDTAPAAPAEEVVAPEAAVAAMAEPQPAAEQPAPVAPLATPPAPAAPTPVAQAPAPPVAVPAGDADAPMRGVVSPVVRRIAAEHGLDLALVPGSGEGGRITRKDVMGFIDSGGAAAVPAAAPPAHEPAAPAPAAVVPEAPAAATPPAERPAAPPPVVAPAAAAAAAPAVSAPRAAAPAPAPSPAAGPAESDVPAGAGDEIVEIPRLRRRIAENLVHAKRSTAHVWASVEVDYERVEQVRRRHREAFKAQEGFSLTYLPFIARATVDALAAFPVVNSSFYLEQGKQVFHGRANLGIAVDVDQKGLVVVTVRSADGLRLKGIAREIRAMADKARGGGLDPDDIAGSTFSITNPGPYGSFMTAPVLNLPNVAILSTDTVVKRPTVVTDAAGGDSIAIHHIGYLGLTWDHRAFDGSTAVLFLARIKENLETWDWERELT